MEPILFELESILGVDDKGGFVATFTLVEDDEMPPIVAQKCPECGESIGDFEQHDCCRM